MQHRVIPAATKVHCAQRLATEGQHGREGVESKGALLSTPFSRQAGAWPERRPSRHRVASGKLLRDADVASPTWVFTGADDEALRQKHLHQTLRRRRQNKLAAKDMGNSTFARVLHDPDEVVGSLLQRLRTPSAAVMHRVRRPARKQHHVCGPHRHRRQIRVVHDRLATQDHVKRYLAWLRPGLLKAPRRTEVAAKIEAPGHGRKGQQLREGVHSGSSFVRLSVFASELPACAQARQYARMFAHRADRRWQRSQRRAIGTWRRACSGSPSHAT